MTDDERKAKDRETYQKYYAEHSEQIKEKVRKWQAQNPEKVKTYKRKWLDNNREQVYAANEKWANENPEKKRAYVHKWQSNNRDKACESTRNWAANNRDKVRETKLRRRALEIGSTIGEIDLELVWNRANGICYLCGKAINRNDCHFDHVIPLSKGGSHSNDNLRPTHAKCNQKKHTKIIKWLQGKLF